MAGRGCSAAVAEADQQIGYIGTAVVNIQTGIGTVAGSKIGLKTWIEIERDGDRVIVIEADIGISQRMQVGKEVGVIGSRGEVEAGIGMGADETG